MGPDPEPGGLIPSALDRYLSEIGEVSLLSPEEEGELARRVREEADPEALERLVRANLRFVVSIAKRYRHRGVALADLVNEGNLGLIRAARRFDERRGVRFVSYAVWWIRQAILQAIERNGDGPRTGGEPRRRYVSLDAPVWSDVDTRLQEVLSDEESEGPEERTQRRALRDALDRSLAVLPEREEEILRLYFGLDGEDPCTLAEIGGRLGVSRERIRQLKDRALARLRADVRRRILEAYYR